MSGLPISITKRYPLKERLLQQRVGSVRNWRSIVIYGLTFAITISVYLMTIAPDLTWANYSSDGGELITAAVTLGIPHPPGYPTYILLGKLISYLPVGTIAYRFNLMSAVSAAIASGFICLIAFKYISHSKTAGLTAVAAGLTIAFTPLVWSQATVSEVYALNFALAAAFLWALLGKKPSFLIGVLLGLAITTHLISVLLVPLAYFLTQSGRRKRLLAGLILGLTPLLMLPILANQDSPVTWGNPSTFEGWLWLVSARLYWPNINWESMLSPEFAQLFPNWSQTVLKQLAVAGWLFVIIGVRRFRRGSKEFVALLFTAALIGGFSILYNPADSIILFLPVLLLLSPIIAIGFSQIGPWSLLLPAGLLLFNFGSQNLGEDQNVRPLVENLYDELPQDAVVVTPGDQSIFSLWYFTHVEDQRVDLVLVDSNLFAFDWYRQQLKNKYAGLLALEKDDMWLFQTENVKERPICRLSLQSPGKYRCYGDAISLAQSR